MDPGPGPPQLRKREQEMHPRSARLPSQHLQTGVHQAFDPPLQICLKPPLTILRKGWPNQGKRRRQVRRRRRRWVDLDHGCRYLEIGKAPMTGRGLITEISTTATRVALAALTAFSWLSCM